VAGGFSQPVFITNAGDGSSRLFVVERQGTIRIISGGSTLRDPFLDIRSLITASGQEQGLLGLAFHPRYRENGRFFVYYTARNGDNTVEEYRVSSDPNRAEATATARLLSIRDFASNHNGGMLAFGKDGFLYAGTGDGGGAGDPQRTAQNRDHLLGKVLRLDVDGGRPYAVPQSNPFVNTSGARPEVWAYGLRNPWRFTFDRQTGDLWIGDVGQNAIEEINFQPANSRGGENYGWSTMEGSQCFRPSSGCITTGLVLPVTEYARSGGRCAVIGGYVYRGQASPAMNGAYLYGDNCSGQVWSLQRDASGAWQSEERLDTDLLISAFGEDEAGEIYALDLRDGAVHRLSATAR
jgi:glucose/arabinose dehydrogenase